MSSITDNGREMTSDYSESPLGTKRSKCRKRNNKPRSKKMLHQCPHCPYSSKRYSLLKDHIHTHTGEKPYTCKLCGQCFAASSNHYRHMRTHMRRLTDEEIACLKVRRTKKIHQCPHCPYSTKIIRNLKFHIHTHTGEKPYSCKECGRCFTTSSNCNKHMRTQHSAN